MKKIFAILVSAVMLVSTMAVFADAATDAEYAAAANALTTEALAALESGTAETATVIINGKTMVFDAEPLIIHDRTVVPMRAIFEELGAKVEWLDESQLIIASRDGRNAKMITMKIGKDTMAIADVSNNTNTVYDLDVVPFLLPVDGGDRTLIPLRAVSEALDASVAWDEATSTVTITQ